MRIARLGLVAALLAGSTACSAPVESTPLPDGIVAHIDQSRIQRQGRLLFLRVENNTTQDLTITRFVLTSPRFRTVRWSGREEVGSTYQSDLEFTMPSGRCGSDIDARVRFTYTLGNGDPRESTTTADDRYGNAADFADRDCARLTLESAASIRVGAPSVEGAGRSSVLTLPVTMTPTGRRTDVRFAGFGDTVLFRQAPGSPSNVDVSLGPGDPTARVDMKLVPARCDPHALAEDKVGRLFPVKVLGDDVGQDASFYLPLTSPQRLALFDFLRANCGIG